MWSKVLKQKECELSDVCVPMKCWMLLTMRFVNYKIRTTFLWTKTNVNIYLQSRMNEASRVDDSGITSWETSVYERTNEEASNVKCHWRLHKSRAIVSSSLSKPYKSLTPNQAIESIYTSSLTNIHICYNSNLLNSIFHKVIRLHPHTILAHHKFLFPQVVVNEIFGNSCNLHGID